MPNSTTETSIIDRALQLLGLSQISSPQQVGSRGAKAMQRAYQPVLLSELQKHYWHFAIKRAQLPASNTPPVHTKKNAFPLPGDYIMLAPEDQYGELQQRNDWIIEGNSIISDENGPIYIRYVSRDITTNMFDAIFAEAFSAALAVSTCEDLTNSLAKLERVGAIYIDQIAIARKRGSILSQKPRLPVSSWISRRG